MKLIRFGKAGYEHPGIVLQDGTMIDIKKFTQNIDRDFLEKDNYKYDFYCFLYAISRVCFAQLAECPDFHIHVQNLQVGCQLHLQIVKRPLH